MNLSECYSIRGRFVSLVKHPPGAIRFRRELLDLVIEARKEKKAIRIYLVSQSGYMSEFFITSKSRMSKPKHETGLASGSSFYSVNGWRKSHFRDNGYYKSEILTGSYNIECSSSSNHCAFTNFLSAKKYSDHLKDDAAYVACVKAHHAWCNKIFRDFT